MAKDKSKSGAVGGGFLSGLGGSGHHTPGANSRLEDKYGKHDPLSTGGPNSRLEAKYGKHDPLSTAGPNSRLEAKYGKHDPLSTAGPNSRFEAKHGKQDPFSLKSPNSFREAQAKKKKNNGNKNKNNNNKNNNSNKKSNGDNDQQVTGDPKMGINNGKGVNGFLPFSKSLNRANDALQKGEDLKHPVQGAKRKLKHGAQAAGRDAAGAGLAGYYGAQVGEGVGHSVAGATQGVLGAAKSALGSIGSTIGNAAHAVGSGISGAFSSISGTIGGMATSLGASAGAAATTGVTGAIGTMVGIPVATIATVVGLATPLLSTPDDTGTACQNDQQAAQTMQYSANYKLTGSQVFQDVEKWGMKEGLSASQVAAILGSVQQESSMAANGNHNLLGWSNTSGTNADHSHDTTDVSAYLTDYVNHIGSPKYGGAPAAYQYFKKNFKTASPEKAGYFFGKFVVVAEDMGSRVNYAQQFYSKITGKGASSTVELAANDNATTSKEASEKICNNKTATDVASTADGTGVIKEDPGSTYLMWNHDGVPADVKPYIHTPEQIGMKWATHNSAWPDPDSDGECVPFAENYFAGIWHVSVKNAMYGRETASTIQSSLGNKGTMSHTPHAGDIASAQPNVTPLTGGSYAGHTFVVLHVLKNGDAIIVQQNFPAISSNGFKGSGSYIHTPYSWNYGVLSHKLLNQYKSSLDFFSPDQKKFKLHWTK